MALTISKQYHFHKIMTKREVNTALLHAEGLRKTVYNNIHYILNNMLMDIAKKMLSCRIKLNLFIYVR